MGHIGGGVHVSSVDCEDFEPDDDPPGGLVHRLVRDGAAMAGLWKPDGSARSTYGGNVLPARETVVVISGSARVEIAGGSTLEVAEGDFVSLPKGTVATWHPSSDFREVWIYSEPG